MYKIYKDEQSVRKAYFAHSMAVKCYILTPIPYIKKLNNSKWIMFYGSFLKGELEKIGGLNRALEDNDSFFMKINPIRYLIYSLVMEIDNSFIDIYWHNEFGEYVFIDFDNPFCRTLKNNREKYLTYISDENIMYNLNSIEKALHCGKSMNIFSRYGFSTKFEYVLRNIDNIRESLDVGCLS